MAPVGVPPCWRRDSAAFLCLSFLIFSVPYIRAKRRQSDEAKAAHAIATQFEGSWVTASGEKLEISGKDCKTWFSTE